MFTKTPILKTNAFLLYFNDEFYSSLKRDYNLSSSGLNASFLKVTQFIRRRNRDRQTVDIAVSILVKKRIQIFFRLNWGKNTLINLLADE